MAERSIWGARFDRENDFIVRRPFKHKGVPWKRGSVFDKTVATTRTLRQLHDTGFIEMRDQEETVTVAPKNPAEVRHVGRGRFVLFRGEERLSEPMSREEAEAALAAS